MAPDFKSYHTLDHEGLRFQADHTLDHESLKFRADHTLDHTLDQSNTTIAPSSNYWREKLSG